MSRSGFRKAAPAAVVDPAIDDPERVAKAARTVPPNAKRVMVGNCVIGYRHNPRPRPWSIANHRVREIERIIKLRHGGPCDTDDGEVYFILVVNSLALHVLHANAGRTDPLKFVSHRLHEWATRWTPRVPATDLVRIIERALQERRLWRADTAAKLLKLTMAERMAAEVTTIGATDCPKEERDNLAKARKAERKRERERARGAKPRAEYEAAAMSKTKPWEYAGVSRATWYRQRKRAPEGRATSGPETRETSPSPTRDIESIALHVPVSRPEPAPAAAHDGPPDVARRGPEGRATIPNGDTYRRREAAAWAWMRRTGRVHATWEEIGAAAIEGEGLILSKDRQELIGQAIAAGLARRGLLRCAA